MNQVRMATLVAEIGKVAPQVGKEYAEQQAAFQAERNGRIEVFQRAIEMAKPALEAILDPVPGVIPDSGWCGFPIVDEWGPDGEKKPMPGTSQRVCLAPDGGLFLAFRRLTPMPVPIGLEYVVNHYDVGAAITALHGAIVKQAGKRCRSAAEATNDARKLAAIVTLLDD